MNYEEGMIVECYLQGCLVGELSYLIEALYLPHNKNKLSPETRIEMEEIIKGTLDSLVPNIPKELIEDVIKMSPIDDVPANKLVDNIYFKYQSYLENTPLYDKAYNTALNYLDKRRKIEGYSEILEGLANQKLHNCSDTSLTICIQVSNKLDKQNGVSLLTAADIKTRMAVVAALTNDEKVITLDKEASIDSLAKKLFAEETDDYRVYKYNGFFIRIKNHSDYEIFEIVNIDTTKPWYVMKNHLGEEILQYFAINEYNELLLE